MGQWAEAARSALRTAGKTLTIPEMWEVIDKQKYWPMDGNSDNPLQTLRNEVRRYLEGFNHVAPGDPKLFYQERRGVYGLIELRDHKAAEPENTDPPKVTKEPTLTRHVGSTPTMKHVPSEESFFEGTPKCTPVTRFERNPKNRAACIKHWGSMCSVCRLDFAKGYGALGVGFIEVHHIEALSKVGRTHRPDPVRDMRPVCPNCHAMLHRKRPALTVEDLQSIRRAARQARRP